MSDDRPVAVYTGAGMAANRFTRASPPGSGHHFEPARLAAFARRFAHSARRLLTLGGYAPEGLTAASPSVLAESLL